MAAVRPRPGLHGRAGRALAPRIDIDAHATTDLDQALTAPELADRLLQELAPELRERPVTGLLMILRPTVYLQRIDTSTSTSGRTAPAPTGEH
ncbi:hypothetical protein ABT160_43560 [Streptomyces sp. NPDC001941]|uniref:hypothetical protein n=1 Tax=Streptomyces sp. NPDC001941 TaxID=3154659 RepID=UPI00331BEF78